MNKTREWVRFVIILLVLLIICGTVFFVMSVPRNVKSEQARGGVLDLTGEDFSYSLFVLGGEWEFYYGKLYAPADFTDGTAGDRAYITVPGDWSTQGWPLAGYATYRLQVLTGEPELMLRVPEIASASVIYVNGRKIFEAGVVGTTEAEHRMSAKNAYIPVFTENGAVEIIIRASNYAWEQAGLVQRLEIGRSIVVLRDAIIRYMCLAVFIGMVLMTGLYHLVLFLHRLKDIVYALFAMFCLIGASRFFLETNAFGEIILPDGLGLAGASVYTVLIILQMVMLVFFTHASFEIPYGGKTRRVIYGAAFLIPVFCAVVFPFMLDPVFLALIILIPMIMSAVSAARSKLAGSSPYYVLYVAAMMIFIVWGPLTKVFLNDLFFIPGVVSNLFLICCQSLMLSHGYAETKRREEALTEHNELLNTLNRTKTEFLQDMSHEMKAPLTIIATGIDYSDSIISEENGDISKAREALGKIRVETQRLGRMVSGMITLVSMNETGDNRKRVDFAALLINSAEAYRVALEQRNNSLRVEIASSMPDAFVENDKFTQVIANLFSNAADHTQNGRITLIADSDGAYITVTVTDTGEGIEPELLPRVFERGVSGRGGTGYGLYICKTVVEAHGGTIKIESEAGKGTAVTFTVPVYGGQEAGHTTA